MRILESINNTQKLGKVPNGCGESMVASIGEKRNYVLSSVLNEERRPGEDAGE